MPLEEILTNRNRLSEDIRRDVKEAAAGYGVSIGRADVKDLIFPGNLREIMNRVIETERESEAKVIEARKNAEVAGLEAESHARTMQQRLETDEKAARILAENPQLIRLKELEVLREIGVRGGNHFYLGLEGLGERPAADDSAPRRTPR